MCLIDISCYLDHFLKGFYRLVGPTNACSYGRIEPIIWTIESFPPLPVTLVEHMQMNSTQISLIGSSQRSSCSWGLGHYSVLWLTMCAHLFRHPYTLCVQISNISMWNNSMKIMLICGLHWHYRYSIVDFYIVLLHFCVVYRDLLWPTSTKCVQTLLKLVYFNRNSLYTSCSSHYSVI